MNVNQVSFGFTTDKVKETKEFYEIYFGATTIFEMEDYVNLKFGDGSTILSIASPQGPEEKPSDSTGIGFGFTVDDVNQVYKKFRHENINIEMPIEDHPSGERGFEIKDPNGISIYIYSIIGEPTEEYKKYMK